MKVLMDHPRDLQKDPLGQIIELMFILWILIALFSSPGGWIAGLIFLGGLSIPITIYIKASRKL